MGKIYLTITFLVGGLFLGILAQRIAKGRVARDLPEISRFLKEVCFVYLGPVTLISIFWILKIPDIKLALLPFLGVLGVAGGGFCGFQAARILGLPRKQTGAMIISGGFSNIGMFAGFICFVIFGEIGYGLVSLYKLLEEFTLVVVGCPMAAYFGNTTQQKSQTRIRLHSLLRDKYFMIPILSLLSGALLNMTGVTRPPIFEMVNAVIIPLMSFILLFAVGLTLKVKAIGSHYQELAAIATIKFGIIPILVLSVSWLLGYQHILHGLLFRLISIIAVMPVGFNALIISSLYGLDEELANSCWVVTTGALLVILPLTFYAIHFLNIG